MGGGAVGTVCALALPATPNRLMTSIPAPTVSPAAIINCRLRSFIKCSMILSFLLFTDITPARGWRLPRTPRTGRLTTGRNRRTMPTP